MNTEPDNIEQFPAAEPTEPFVEIPSPESILEGTDTFTNSLTLEPIELGDDVVAAVKLGDVYDHCLLGATARGKYAYSIKKLMEFQVRDMGVSEDEARRIIGEDIVELDRKWGTRSPEFIDDELTEQRIEIIMPS